MRFLCAFLLLFPLCTQAQNFSLRNKLGAFELEVSHCQWMEVGDLYDTLTDRYQVWLSDEDTFRFAVLYKPNSSAQLTVLTQFHEVRWKYCTSDNPNPEPTYFSNYFHFPQTPFLFDFVLKSSDHQITAWPTIKTLSYTESANKAMFTGEGEFGKGEWEAKAAGQEWSIRAVLHTQSDTAPNYTWYTIKWLSDSIPDSISRFMRPELFQQEVLDSMEAQTRVRRRGIKSQLELFMEEAKTREPVTWEYFYLQDLHSDTGRTFQSLFSQGDSILVFFLYPYLPQNEPYLRILRYYQEQYPENPVQVVWLYEKRESQNPLPPQAPLYGLTPFERNRLGFTERAYGLVNRNGVVVSSSSNYKKFYEFLKAVGGVEE